MRARIDNARLADPLIEVLRIPVEGKEIIGYLQKPSGLSRPSVVISIGGLDGYREFVVEQYGAGYLRAGLAYLALDMPGTGDARIKIDVGFEWVFSRVIDALQARSDIDPQVPIEDLYIVLRSGSTAKEAWVNPTGGHIGRNREWSDAQIFESVVTPWFARRLR